METLNFSAAGTNSMVYLMKNYAAYNLWANRTLINWLNEKPAELMEIQTPSSFSTIKKTIVHIWHTQVYWLSIIKNEPTIVPEEFNGNTAEAFAKLIEQSKELMAYISKLNEQELTKKGLVINPWFECNFQNFEYLVQLLNHSTYHRGQIITMAHCLGIKGAPMTDYNYYNIYGRELSTLEFTQQLLSTLNMVTATPLPIM
ncbi:DinB family protein [Pedobacter sp. UC225_65]|uniref:DinB family protein n=1 Tax=Pedobacter sp. UC225_65 TaxID=3350173 RepID=UPI00366C1EBC